MAYYDDRLQTLGRKLDEQRRLQSELRELYARRPALEKSVYELNQSRLKEQYDVEQLEGGSLAAFFYGVIGKKDEKLDKERAEAYAAAVKYDAAARELASVQEEIAHREAEVDELGDCEKEYERLLAEKTAAVKAGGSTEGLRILQIEEELARLSHRQKELSEAISAGQRAESCAQRILKRLSSAEGWGTWDMLGGGMLSDIAKHSELNTAQREVEQLQLLLSRFKTELADVRLEANMQVSVDGFLRFADYFFDNLFTDWAVMDKIHRSQDQVRQTDRQIGQLLTRLQQMRESERGQMQRLEQEREMLVRQAKL